MALEVTREMVAAALEAAIPRLARELPTDVYAGLQRAFACEPAGRGSVALGHLLASAQVACCDQVPICQDTGTVWCSLEIGPDVAVAPGVFADVDAVVARTYETARLRKSLVRNALFDRANTGDNTPCFTDIHPVDQPGVARIRVMLKGGGSDNASRVVMLAPGAGREAIVAEVVRCVREKASSACAPCIVGVGVGSTFDKVGGLAKRALMRRLDEEAPDAETAQFERELLEAINASGTGPQGLGGVNAALGVRVSTAPCHIAALPLAINMGCSAMRRATIDLTGESAEAQLDAQLVSAKDFAQAPVRQQAAGDRVHKLALPLSKTDLAGLKAGDACTLTGALYTLRDAGHVRLLADMAENDGKLPYGLEGQTIFYAGPTPSAAGRPFGAVGPTTAGRMDFAAPALYSAGIVATVGKGHRDQSVARSCKENATVFFVATGGAAALLAKQVTDAETIAYEDLGTEALRRIEVVDFPVFVGIDAQGTDVYDTI